jgi:hypothetical protein
MRRASALPLALLALSACSSETKAPPGYRVKGDDTVGNARVVTIEPEVPRDPARLAAACSAAKGGASCREYALSLLGRDDAQAEQTWYELCEHDDFVACSQLAYQYANPYVILPRTSERAAAVATKACEHHAEPISCATLAGAYKKGQWGLPVDPAKARSLVVAACKDRHYWSCQEAGLPPP